MFADSSSAVRLGLGYGCLKDIDVPWLKSRPTPRVSKVSRKIKKAGMAMAAETAAAAAQQVFPATLDKVVRATVARPKKSRTTKEKDEEEEILLIEGIELGGLGRGSFVKFDVFINAEDETVIGPGNSEFAGSFVKLPRKHNRSDENTSKTCLRLGITHLLEDLGADDDDEIVVSFVPRSGADNVTVGRAMIEFGS
jgi:polyphenol oxidase